MNLNGGRNKNPPIHSSITHSSTLHSFSLQFIHPSFVHSSLHSLISDLFTVSVHDGLTSTSPAVATFWGSIETDVASTICGRYETGGPRRRTPGPLKPHRMNTTSLEPDDWASTPMGNATIVVSRSMYVRLRGLFHPEDKFTFLYRLYHRPVTVHNADEGQQ